MWFYFLLKKMVVEFIDPSVCAYLIVHIEVDGVWLYE